VEVKELFYKIMNNKKKGHRKIKGVVVEIIKKIR
jgi:hypothetical protein